MIFVNLSKNDIEYKEKENYNPCKTCKPKYNDCKGCPYSQMIGGIYYR